MDHNIYLQKNNKYFNKQLDTTEIIKLHTSFNNHTKHNINNNTQHETQSNCSQQALKKVVKTLVQRVILDKRSWNLISILKTYWVLRVNIPK